MTETVSPDGADRVLHVLEHGQVVVIVRVKWVPQMEGQKSNDQGQENAPIQNQSLKRFHLPLFYGLEKVLANLNLVISDFRFSIKRSCPVLNKKAAGARDAFWPMLRA
jgi:hypothetical protein